MDELKVVPLTEAPALPPPGVKHSKYALAIQDFIESDAEWALLEGIGGKQAQSVRNYAKKSGVVDDRIVLVRTDADKVYLQRVLAQR